MNKWLTTILKKEDKKSGNFPCLSKIYAQVKIRIVKKHERFPAFHSFCCVWSNFFQEPDADSVEKCIFLFWFRFSFKRTSNWRWFIFIEVQNPPWKMVFRWKKLNLLWFWMDNQIKSNFKGKFKIKSKEIQIKWRSILCGVILIWIWFPKNLILWLYPFSKGLQIYLDRL